MSDRVISDTWDEYRELHPTTPSFVSHPHFKPMASEIDMFQDAAQTLVLANGIERQPDAGQDLEVAAVQPPAVVRHLMQHLRKASREMGGLRELRTLRGFFILALEWRSLDINEYLIDVKWREGSEEEEGKDDVLGLAEGLGGLAIGDDEKRGRLEVNRSPVLAYGWGTGLWLGDTKKLADRAWF